MKEENKKVTLVLVIFAILIVLMFMVVFKGSEEVSTGGIFDLHVDASFNKDEVISQGYPTMLDVGGADCIPCKAMAPVLERLNEDLNGKAIIKFVDYWKYPDLAKQFTFSSIPTQFFYDENGNLYTTHEGQITEAQVLEIFEEMGYTFD